MASSLFYFFFIVASVVSIGSTPLCSKLNDCLPFHLQNITTSFVECNSEDGQCHCYSCFILNVTSNQCYTLINCTLYDDTTNSCMDIRRSQLIAIIFAVVLTIGGAANFYIDRLDLAIPQLALGALFTLFPFIGFCIKGVLDDFDYTYDRIKRIVWIIKFVLYSIVTLALLAWYVADIVTFAVNTRLDGQGCPLRTGF